MRARKYTVNNASMRASFFRNTGAISCTDLSCSKRFSMRRLALVGGEHLGRGEAGVVCDQRVDAVGVLVVGDGLGVERPLDVVASAGELAIDRIGPGAARGVTA